MSEKVTPREAIAPKNLFLIFNSRPLDATLLYANYCVYRPLVVKLTLKRDRKYIRKILVTTCLSFGCLMVGRAVPSSACYGFFYRRGVKCHVQS